MITLKTQNQERKQTKPKVSSFKDHQTDQLIGKLIKKKRDRVDNNNIRNNKGNIMYSILGEYIIIYKYRNGTN